MGRPLGRIKRRDEYLAVAAARTKWVAPGFVLQAFARPGTTGSDVNPETRVGFTASRKVGGAVVRNRAKRRLRALASQVIGEMGKPGMDYVLIGRRDTATLPFETLEQDLRKALSRLKAPKPKPGAMS